MKHVARACAIVLMVFTVSCFELEVMQRMTAEEAGWYVEVGPVSSAACAVGPPEKVVVAYAKVRCGYGENCPTGTKTVPLYGMRNVSMPAPEENSEQYWRDTKKRLTALLPPDGLEEMHRVILGTLAAQLALSDTQSPLSGDQRSAELVRIAGATCSQFREFERNVLARQAPPKERLAESFTISFQPVGSPAAFGLNHKGEFFVSVSESIPTPYGELSFSRAKSTASPVKPKRLVIRSSGRERVLFLDRDFEVFVPAKHGVKVANTDTELILDVDARMPAAKDTTATKRRNKRRST